MFPLDVLHRTKGDHEWGGGVTGLPPCPQLWLEQRSHCDLPGLPAPWPLPTLSSEWAQVTRGQEAGESSCGHSGWGYFLVLWPWQESWLDFLLLSYLSFLNFIVHYSWHATYKIILVSGVQPSNSIFIDLRKWSPRSFGWPPVTVRARMLLLTLFPWLIYNWRFVLLIPLLLLPKTPPLPSFLRINEKMCMKYSTEGT